MHTSIMMEEETEVISFQECSICYPHVTVLFIYTCFSFFIGAQCLIGYFNNATLQLKMNRLGLAKNRHK